MNIFNFQMENWYTLTIRLNLYMFMVVLFLVFLLSWILKRNKYIHNKHINIDEFTLGIGNSNLKLSYNKKDKEIAYQIWVELNTRKIGIPFEEDKDVIVEVYDSWYDFFKITRELLKGIPASRIPYSTDLIELTMSVLNVGLRPHLTQWQAKYRKWYSIASKNDTLSPQEIQKQYDNYDELVKDLIITNERMIQYKNLMKKIAFDD